MSILLIDEEFSSCYSIEANIYSDSNADEVLARRAIDVAIARAQLKKVAEALIWIDENCKGDAQLYNAFKHLIVDLKKEIE